MGILRGVASDRSLAVVTLLAIVASSGTTGCDTTSQPIFISGVDVTGNEPPVLTILRPSQDVSINQGEGLVIEWLDTDEDSNARVSFSLVSTDDPDLPPIALVDGIMENEDGTGDRFTASTGFVPRGNYNLRGRIDDGVNRPVSALAMNRVGGVGAIVVRIVEEGTATTNLPPQIFIRDPAFNLSVSQDDRVTVVVQPTNRDPNVDPVLGPIINDPYDGDSTALLYFALDLDDDPLNDEVIAPDPTKIILLNETPFELLPVDSAAIQFEFTIDLESIPLRPDGQPYRIRVTITDGQNNPVHEYAAGTLNVVRAASGALVDLGRIGRTLSGVRFQGFNPGSRLGTRMINVRDFDLDGVDDFVLVALFGNPRNFGNIGEAYIIYGLANQRFGGTINVNSTSKSIPGVIFEAPPHIGVAPNRVFRCGGRINVTNPRTEGITDVSFIPDINGDGRPELIFGMPHVDGVFTTRDDDPGDDPPEGDETLDVDLVLRQGESELTIQSEPEDIEIVFGYFDMEDVVIDSNEPNTNFRRGDIEWVNGGPGNQKWTLIKFKNVIEQFPTEDTPDRISEISGDLTFRVLDPGGQATIHELFRDFDETSTTFNSFGEPVPIDDYDEDELGSIDAAAAGEEITIGVDVLLQRLLFGELGAANNELRFIIVPGDADQEDSDNPARLASKEFDIDARDRPTLEISYNRELLGGPLGCYPDLFANNFADDENLDNGCNERKFEALGFVTIVDSTNRDAASRLDPDRLSDVIPDRLTNTVMSLELPGMRPAWPLEFDINANAQAFGDEDSRVAGMRFTAGWYDYYDHLQLGQPPLNGLYGQSVSWMPDVNLDGFPEVVISAPLNERDLLNVVAIPNSTHAASRAHFGSIIIIPGADFDDDLFRDKPGDTEGTSCLPFPADMSVRSGCDPGRCSSPGLRRCGPWIEAGTWEIFAEHPDDFLGGARSPGDFNLDSVPDIMCGAPLNDRSDDLEDTGAMYIIFGRSPVGNVRLAEANDPRTRPPMIRVFGEKPGDKVGWKQEPITDVNGDRIDDVLFSAPAADFIVPKPECIDFSAEGARDSNLFNGCRDREVFLDDTCKMFDYNNDRVVDNDDRAVFDCLAADGGTDCCPVDNGYVGIIFGGVTRQGDRVISQVGTSDFPGVIFYGSRAGDRAGYDISSAGDFDQDGFGDILISVPGEIREDDNARRRMGVTYLIYGGPHLADQEVPIELSEIGNRIPGIVFLSPYEAGAPDEAPTDSVGFVGDINNDGFGDIAIGATFADLLDEDFPQGIGENPTGRRPDQGDVYIIYGNNINR